MSSNVTNNLTKSLYCNEVNKTNFNSFIESYKRNSDVFIAFLGAGISTSLRGIPDFRELYEVLCKKYEYREKEKKYDNLPYLFSLLYQQIEDKKNFDNSVFDAILPKNSKATTTHIEIARAFNSFITTNYYDPIEDAFKKIRLYENKETKELCKYYFTFPKKENVKYSLTYLHGNQDIGFCVLRESDYKYFYPSLNENHLGVYVLENSLSEIFTNWNVVFLGISIELNLKQFMNYLCEKIKIQRTTSKDTIERKDKKHYWITDDSDIKQFLKLKPEKDRAYFESVYFENYSKSNISPIIYCGNHIFVENLCETLTKYKETEIVEFMGDTFNPEKLGDL